MHCNLILIIPFVIHDISSILTSNESLEKRVNSHYDSSVPTFAN